MTLIEELRSSTPQVIADALEKAEENWARVVEQMRSVGSRGGRKVVLEPPNESPMARAVMAAIAARAETEGFAARRLRGTYGPLWEIRW